MRRVVLQMMTTLNGRLDDPDAWMVMTGDKLDQEIGGQYLTFDSLFVGYTTYKEMAEYWPAAETDPESIEDKDVARRMNAYKKYVISSGDTKEDLEWNNAEMVLIHSDEELVSFVNDLKSQEGKDMHLPGGARLAQSFIRLGLVDEFHFYIHPTISKGGLCWFDTLEDKYDLELVSTEQYDNGIVGVYYRPAQKHLLVGSSYA